MRLVSLRAFASALLVCAFVATMTTSAAAQTFNISEIEEGPERSITCPDGKTYTTKLRPIDSARMAEFDVAFCIMIDNVGNQTPTTPSPGEPVTVDPPETTTPTAPPANLPQTCGGKTVTIYGTSGPDIIDGTDGPDVIHGLQGDDWINGLEGDDIICGGKGDDRIHGDLGFDVIYGAQGNDKLYAKRGGGDYEDIKGSRIFGGAGHDSIYGSGRWDRMQGGTGHDRIHDGHNGDSWGGKDWIRGGSGNDYIESAGTDDLNGGLGHDLYRYDRATIRKSWGIDACLTSLVSNPDYSGCEATDDWPGNDRSAWFATGTQWSFNYAVCQENYAHPSFGVVEVRDGISCG